MHSFECHWNHKDFENGFTVDGKIKVIRLTFNAIIFEEQRLSWKIDPWWLIDKHNTVYFTCLIKGESLIIRWIELFVVLPAIDDFMEN